MRHPAPLFAASACLAFIVSCGDSSNTLVSPHDTISEQNSSSSENNATQSYSSAGTSEHHSSSASSHQAGSSNAASSSSSAVLAVSSCSAKAPDLQVSSSSRSSHRRSSSSTRNPSSSARTPTSSQQKTATSSSQPSAIDAGSSSSANPPPASSATQAANISLDENGFATVADVYKSLAADEKAVFIIRHSEREDNVAIETELTANGVKMAQDLGATLKSDEEFSYITSGFVRTNETANNISKGRGEANLPKLITNYDITGNWFLKISADSLAQYATQLNMKGSSVELMGHWAYEGGYPDALYELEPRAEEFMQKVILKNLSKWKRVSIMVSHDILVMPLAVFGSNKKVALKYHEDYHWINYIAGLAIIVDAQNNLRYIPVKGAESGVIDYLALYRKEHGITNPKIPNI
ncbi:histidine phosphatase family protein [Fibrobacter sp.]|uniref:histidine phosphatase family protein n=1 Tax=Fibrobacter sp. TaxID=35828 RepID=UPI0025BE5BBA|nr:histidine phosphatase family protein [Fibrobacter sp.]MBR3071733.1 histidine phosphatase family protein [Fibrobacter sp.]